MKKAGTVLDGAFSKLEENSLRTTKFFDIAGTYEKLKTLTEPVEVQLKELDFYKGGHGPEYDYIPDASYEPRHFEYWATDVHLEDILNSFDEGQITFVGPAGAGKTTLMKTVARNILSRKYDGLKGIKAVHYADLRKYRGDENMTVQDYLFLNNEVQLTTEERIAVVQYCISKPNQVIFIIDSLDTLQYSPDKGDSQMQIHEKRDPPTILRNLLSGSLLEKCRFITSSREYAIKGYDEKLRAKKVIALDGMSAKAMHEMIHQYLDEDDANELIAFLENHPILLTMSETPLFLALTVMVSKEVMSLKTQSVATVLICALQLFLRSAHNKGLDCPLEKIKKLEILAAKLTEEHRVLFGIGDLEEIGLLLEDVWDLAISSPKGPQQKLILGEEILFFAHQSIQELLTGFHFIRKNEEGFKEILKRMFGNRRHKKHYSVVKRLLSGTLFDDDILKTSEFFGDLNEEDIKKKQILMRETIQDEVSQGKVTMDFALLIAECGSNLSEIKISENVEIDTGHSTLTAGRGYALGLLLQRCTSVKKLNISGGVQTQGLQNVYQQVCGLNLQIELLVLPLTNIGSSAMEVIGKLLCCSTVKRMYFGPVEVEFESRFTACEVASLGVNLDDNVSTKIVGNLTIKEIVQEQVAGLSRFLDLIANPPILNFEFSTQSDVGNCCLVFKKYLVVDPDHNFNYLELCNKLQQTKTLSSFGNLVKKHQIQRIKLTTTRDGYQPTVQEWKEFRKELEGVKIKYLKLRGFVKLDVEHCSEIGRLFENNHSVESFDLLESEMTLKGLEEFKSRVLNTQFEFLRLNVISDEYDRCCYLSSQLMVEGRVEHLTLSIMGKDSLNMKAQWNESGEYLDQLSIDVRSEIVDVSSVLEGLKDKSIGLRKLGINLLVTENFNSNVLFPIIHDVSEKIIIYVRMDERNIEILQEYMSEIYPTARNLRIDINGRGIQGMEQRKSIGGSAVGDTLVPICINKSTEAVVPINGGMIHIDECTLNFLKTTFFKETGVKLKLSNDPRKWPPGFVAIAPLLEVDASGRVQQPVFIKMIAWCYNGSPEEAKDAKVFALHYSSKTSKWEELAVFPFGSDVVYEFQCESFSPIFLGIWEWFFGYASMATEGLIVVSGDIYTLVLVPTRQYKDEMEECRRHGMRHLIRHSTLHVKRGDEIEMSIVPSEGFRFSPEGRFTFKVDDNFMQMQTVCRCSVNLKSGTEEDRLVDFLCDVKQNGKNLHDTQAASVFWEYRRGRTANVEASSGGNTYNIGPGSTVNTNQSTSATGVVSEGGSPNVTLQGSIDIAAASNSQ